MNLDGKAAIITGGGTGVGRETALKLARLGCHVLVNYSRSKDDAEQSVADSATSWADHCDDVAGRGRNVHDIGAIDPRMAAADTLFAARGDGDGGLAQGSGLKAHGSSRPEAEALEP